jgi:uncharacterized protein YegL
MEKGPQINGKDLVVNEQLRHKAETIAIFMGGDYNMTAGVGPWGSGWHWDFVKNHVNMDAKDLAMEPEDVVKGIAAHEGNHRLVSRAEHVMDLWKKPGFSFGFNAVEDPRANEGGMHFRPGSKEWIQAYIERDLSPGGGLDYKSIKKDARDALGYVPKHMQWGGEMIRYWYEKELGGSVKSKKDIERFLKEIPDSDVKEAVKKTLPEFEKYYQTIPTTKDENEVQAKAKESSNNFKDKVWPIYKELVDKSYDEQSLVKMLEDMMSQQGQGQPQSGQGGGQAMEIPFSSLPKELQDEIKQKIEDAQKQRKEEEQMAKKNQQKGEGQKSGDQSQQSRSESQDKGQSKQGEGKEEDGKKIPWDKLSDKAKDATQKAFDQLPENKKEKHQEEAKKSLEDAEDSMNEKLRGKMNDPRHTETNRERREREESEQERADQQKASEGIIREMEKRREEAMKAIKGNIYHDFLVMPDVASIIRAQDRDYKRIFSPSESPDVRHSYSGLRPSMSKAMQYEADPRKGNIFEIKGRPAEKSHRFEYLVDLSRSMTSNIEEVFKVVVINTELLNKYKLENAIFGFTDSMRGSIKLYKDFDQKRLTVEDRDKIGKMVEDCNSGGGTPTLEATVRAFAIMEERNRKYPMQHNYFTTLTDGQPTSSSREELAKKVKQIRKNKSIITCGFGIGSDTQFVDGIYPPLHPRIKKDVARLLGKDPDEVGNSFENAVQFANAYVIIMGYMVEYPELFY